MCAGGPKGCLPTDRTVLHRRCSEMARMLAAARCVDEGSPAQGSVCTGTLASMHIFGVVSRATKQNWSGG